MTSHSKMDFKAIKDAVAMLSKDDFRNPGKKVGDNPRAVSAALDLIEELVSVIRQQESAK